MAKVDININGRLFGVACDEGQEDRVRDLAAMIDQRVRLLAGAAPAGAGGETQILVLAGLMLADELTETKTALAAKGTAGEAAPAQVRNRSDDEELLIAAVDHLTDRIAVIADRLGGA